MDDQKKRTVLIAGLATCALGAGGYLVCFGGSEAEPGSAERRVVAERRSHDPKPEIVQPVRRGRPKNKHNAGSRGERRVVTERTRHANPSRRVRGQKPVVPKKRTLVRAG